MLQVGKTLISLDVLEKQFICDIGACHGVCCVEGDSGAPVEADEIEQIEQSIETVWPMLSDAAKAEIKANGTTYIDDEGDTVTSIINGRECVFTVFEPDGTIGCAFEKAWAAGKIPFRKPISCHLYPIRLTQLKNYLAVNYNNWHICSAARILGRKEGVPVYVFLKEALIRKFGEDWYHEVDQAVKSGIIEQF